MLEYLRGEISDSEDIKPTSQCAPLFESTLLVPVPAASPLVCGPRATPGPPLGPTPFCWLHHESSLPGSGPASQPISLTDSEGVEVVAGKGLRWPFMALIYS